MGAVKQALLEVEDLVCSCLQSGRTLNQTIRDLKKQYDDGIMNTYLLDADLIEDKYYQFKGSE